MRVAGIARRTIWVDDDGWSVQIIDQTKLPHAFETLRLQTVQDAARAIASMQVRGAPLIGVAAAYGLCLALREDPSDASLQRAKALLAATRPTAVNLQWALGQMRRALAEVAPAHRAEAAYAKAAQMAEEDVLACAVIGRHGLGILRAIHAAHPGRAVQVLTHCNAGWLATVDWGTALAPVFAAHDAGIPVHVWVDETRPRNQGYLTAWELAAHGVPHTVVVDNTGGHLMQRGRVDVCLVGTDRTTRTGDVCNKVGTYLKALAAKDCGVPFYVAAPASSIDWTLDDGVRDIPIEERHPAEIARVHGRLEDGSAGHVTVTPEGSPALNVAFDVTPARLVTGLVTERGVCAATREGLLGLFPERR